MWRKIKQKRAIDCEQVKGEDMQFLKGWLREVPTKKVTCGQRLEVRVQATCIPGEERAKQREHA